MNYPVRTFKRLDLAPIGPFSGGIPHPFFLERMAYYQWNNAGVFTTGPSMLMTREKEEYAYWRHAQQIEHALHYYMKPHKITFFEHNLTNVAVPNLLTRVWFGRTPDNTNNALVFFERIYDIEKHGRYMAAINNRSWQPDWNTLDSAKSFTQTVTRTDTPYKGCYEVAMELR